MTTIDLVKDSTMQSINTQLELQNAFLAVLAKKESEVNINSWQAVQAIVRSGLHDKIFSIGDQLACKKIVSFSFQTDVSTGVNNYTLNKGTFLSRITSLKDEYLFEYYDSSWHYEDNAVELIDYGITINGTPREGCYIKLVPKIIRIVFDVIGFDVDTPTDRNYKHSMTLLCHAGMFNIALNVPQALYYAAEPLNAGIYSFSVPNVTNSAEKEIMTYNFTLTKDIPAGGQILVNCKANIAVLDAKLSTVTDYTGKTAIERNIALREGDGGTFLGIADGSVDNLNDFWLARYGNSDWESSDVRQWCNNTFENGVWTPRNVFACKPSWTESAVGFLGDLDPEFVNVLGEVTKSTAKIDVVSKYDSSGELTYTYSATGTKETSDKVFILSDEEVYSENKNGMQEGEAYEYFSSVSDTPTENNDSCDARVKYSILGGNISWWLRSPSSWNKGCGYVVCTDGRVGALSAAYSSQWVVPAVNII